MIPPFDSLNLKIPEDEFNSYPSSSHIIVNCALWDIDLQWGIFWKSLKCSMERAVLIVEGTLHLHNYLVNYKKERFDPFDLHLDTSIFQSSLQNYGINYIVVSTDYDRPAGRLNMDDVYNRIKGLWLRDNLKCSLAYHDMHIPRQEEWEQNEYMHTIRT